jgi:hypothetical protein
MNHQDATSIYDETGKWNQKFESIKVTIETINSGNISIWIRYTNNASRRLIDSLLVLLLLGSLASEAGSLRADQGMSMCSNQLQEVR